MITFAGGILKSSYNQFVTRFPHRKWTESGQYIIFYSQFKKKKKQSKH